MAEATLERSDIYPVGTVVGCYLLPSPPKPFAPSGDPSGGQTKYTKTTEATVGAAGKLKLGGLAAGTKYVCWAEVATENHYLYFETARPVEQLAPSVVRSSLKAEGEVEGALTPNYAEGNAVTATMKGALTLEKPIGWPAVPAWMDVSLAQDGVGHTLSIGAGITMPGGEPVWSKLPGAVNQFSLWSPDGGTTVFLFTGPEGKQGVKGTTGAVGETVGSTEATLKMTYPAVNGNPKATSTKPATAWRLQRSMVVIPVKAKKLKLLWTPGAVKGKVRVLVFDTGQKVAGKYSVLADTEVFVAPGVEKVSGILAELERKEGEWAAGEVVMIGVIAESAEMILPISTEPSVGTSCKFPEGAVPAGVALATAWIADQVVLTEVAAKEKPFLGIAEATPVGPAFPLAFAVICA